MSFPALKLETVHGVLGVPLDEPQSRTEEASNALAAALRQDFSSSVRPPLSPDIGNEAPHLVLQGRNIHCVFSRVQADIEARLFGQHANDAELARTFVADKMDAVWRAWTGGGAEPVLCGVILTLHFVWGTDENRSPVQHMLEHHIAHGITGGSISDVKLQLGVRLHDHFFLTLGIGTYEGREVTRAMTATPGVPQTAVIRPWEPEVVEEGIEVTVDVNNRLRAIAERKHTRVDQSEIARVNNVAWDVVKRLAIPLAEDGQFDATSLQEALA